MSTWTIAGVQMDCRLRDTKHNLKTVCVRLREAAAKGARLIVFPECALPGYCYESKEEAWPHAETVPGPASETLAGECRRLGVWAVVGLLEREADRLYNACVLVGPRGLAATYRKIHLPFLGVDRFTTPGDRPFAVHDLDGLRLGMNICYDSSFPESSRVLSLLGADLIVLPTNWPPGARCTARFLVPARALENRVYYAAVNRVGEERGFRFIGQSKIVDCSGDILAASETEREEIIYATIEPEKARQKRIVQIPGEYEVDRVHDRRPEMYGPICEPVQDRRSPRGTPMPLPTVSRRSVLAGAFAGAGWASLSHAAAAEERAGKDAPITSKDPLKITKLETLLIKPRWLFLKVHTNAGIVGLGEPVLEGRALTCAQAVKEIEPYLVGKDPRQVVHHWQAIYRHAFYRGGPILTSALSGIDQALWDIKGKALGVPVYELLGGPTRQRVRVYAHARSPESLKKLKAEGFRAFKTGPAKRRPARYVESPAEVRYAADKFAELRAAGGDDVDIAIDFHGAISPALAKVLIKALEPYNPMFIEEPCQAQNHDVMAEIARGTHLPIATGERVFTKWGFREVLEKKAATILQPDLCHAGGITEVRLIAGMAEAYYAAIAPHNPLGPISLAAGVQLAASIPNFLCQEQVSLGQDYIKHPFTVRDGYLDLPKGPGLGIELDEKALVEKDKIGHDWKNQELYDADDGSVVDW